MADKEFAVEKSGSVLPSPESYEDAVALDADNLLQPGELSYAEVTAGGLGRHLGLFSTTFLIIGRIIGVGIFTTPSSITSSVGSVGAALLLWVLGLILSYCGTFVWLEFGSMFPRSGGEKVYLEAVYKYPKFLATMVFAFNAIFLGFTASGCIVFSSNIVLAADRAASEWEERGIAIALITFITLMHTFVPHWGVRLQNVLGTIKVVILIFIVVTGWVVLSGRVSRVPDPHASFRNSFAGSSTSGYEYSVALFKVLNSYTGWSNAAYVLNEVRNPVRTIKIAAPLGLTVCGILYLLANVAYFAAATPQQIKQSGNTVASEFAGIVFGEAAQQALSVFIALSAFGNVMTVTFTQSRVNQELAKEGLIPFPRFWSSTWPFGAPSAGLLLHWIPSFIVLVAIPFGDAYNFILDVEGYPGSIINLAVVIGLFILRWQAPQLPRPFRLWLPLGFLFMAGQAFLIVAPFLYPPGGKGDTDLPYWLSSVVGIVVLAASVIYWFVWQVLMPKLGRFEYVERKTELKDGTVVIQFEKEKKA